MDRLEALHRQLDEGVAAIRDGQTWRDWLNIASRFHTRSFNNQLLIALQRPDASAVAGYRAWQAMGRQVRKGEKAIWILAPVTRRAGGAEEPVAEAAHTEDTRAEKAPRPVVGFRGAAVWDVTQTDGKPLAQPPQSQLLAGEAPTGLWDALTAAITAQGFTVTRCPDATAIGGANGCTDFLTRIVTVRADVDDAQAVKTLGHEAAHVLLHTPGDPAAAVPPCRDLLEVEAESVAYLVSAHHGLDTGNYTFAYIAGWAGRDNDAVRSTAGRVLTAARTLIAATDPTSVEDPIAVAQVADAARAGATASQTAAQHAEATLGRLTTAASSSTDRLRAVLVDAQAWFQAHAATSSGFTAAVTARGYTLDEAMSYGVGWAPAGWTGVVDHLRGGGHSDADLVAAGVATPARNGRLIDRFRGRVTFPVHDSRGIVGFTARDATCRPDTPKYMNTPATALYDKGKVLFGTQHLPAVAPGTEDVTVVLVEGPWDALAVTHSGAGRIGLAACGTAVTEHHLNLARGHQPGRRLILAPDADAAGLTALGRTLDTLAQHGGTHPEAVKQADGKDLAELHAAGGAAAVTAALDAAQPAGIVYARGRLTETGDLATPERRVAAARAAARYAGGLTPAQQAELGIVLIERAGITAEAAWSIVAPAAPGPTAVGPAGCPRPARPATGPPRRAATL